ncbi:MAG: Gfo/Idh/MocA family oxidoreductase, partial [Chloroflexota bacterium]|nr:Gfo/Idh/MocA family oxidoreductase [Chloroflexota bacterium]
VVDIQPDRAERLAGACGLERWYLDYRAAVSRDDVDVVSVCIPTYLHSEVTVFAAEHGKHVLSEKPMALTLASADAMIAAAARHGVKLGIGFMRPYSPVQEQVRAWLAAGKLGRPLAYHALDARELRPKREMHDAHANGGPVIDMGVHLFDGWARLFDAEPVEVFAVGHRLAAGRPEISHIREVAVDTATVVVRYASGDTGTFVCSWGLPPGVIPPGGPDILFGPLGALHLTYNMTHQEARWLREGGAWETIAACDEDMYQREIAGFARCIIEDQSPPAGGAEGQAALRVALAALESIRTGQSIWLCDPLSASLPPVSPRGESS